MAVVPNFDYNASFDLVDHPHQRPHQHNTFLGVLARRKPDQNTYANTPDVDISDALSHYLVDIEVPGIKDPSSISVLWTSWRSLVVSGSTFRVWRSQHDVVANNATSEDDQQEEREDLPPWLVMGERRIGSFRREFHFPVDIDIEKLDAKLEAGLLRLKVPKQLHTYPRGSGKVKVVSKD
jgi:HSP20 family molecular chaperone IbpA